MSKLRVWRVRHYKVWDEEWTAYDREAAIERSEDYHSIEGWLVETYNRTTASPLREPTREEIDELTAEQ